MGCAAVHTGGNWKVARVAELVDARDLKSLDLHGCTGSIPVASTTSELAFTKAVRIRVGV